MKKASSGMKCSVCGKPAKHLVHTSDSKVRPYCSAHKPSSK